MVLNKMLKSRPEECRRVILMIWIYFNGVIAQENITLVMVTVPNNGVSTTDPRYESTIKERITKIMGEATSPSTEEKTDHTGNISQVTLGVSSTAADHSNVGIPENVTRESTGTSMKSQPLKPTYLPHTQEAVVTPYHSGADDNIYILIGAACTGFLALILFVVLLLFVFKRCQKNDYTKATDTEEVHDDEKGDISGPRWVFNDDRQDWLYDGADDDEDNQYVGPLAGKTGKRTSLMDKRYTHESETFGRASPSQPRKRPPVTGSSGNNLEGMTLSGEGEAKQNIEKIMTDDIGLVEISNIN